MSYNRLKEEDEVQKSIIYSLVARGTCVLAEETLAMESGKRIAGNFHTVLTAKLLPKFPSKDGKYSFIYDKYMFHYINADGLTFLCMSDVDTKRRKTFGFLESIKSRFLQDFGDKVDTAITYGMNAEFAPVLQQKMQKYNDPRNDKMTRAMENIESVKGVMIQSIESIMERGEKLEILVDRTENLANSAQHFRHQGSALRKKMWLRNLKWTLCMSSMGILFLVLIIYGLSSAFSGSDD
eukprot:g1683.t1